MKKEDIEKAAFAYACENQVVPCTGGELEKGFKAGADWRIDSVWHDVKIEPTEEKMLVIINKRSEVKENDYDKNKRYFASTYTWYHEVNTEEIIKWAYKEDLLPNKEE